MRPARYIPIVIATISCISAYGQDLHDYRYYKLFENPEETAPEEKPDSTASIPKPIRKYDARLFDYNFSFVRTSRRGAAFGERRITLNGIDVDYLSRTEAARLQLACDDANGIISGGNTAGNAFGNIAYLSDTTMQRRTSVAFNLSSRNYTTGINATTCHALGRGWSMAADITARTGRDAHIRSIFTNEISLNASFVKRFGDAHLLSFALFVSPTERGTRQSSTAEAFTLRNDNLYSPSWGYRNGKICNSHVRREFVPTIVATYGGKLSDRMRIDIAAGATLGKRRYSMLEWFDAQTPMPDNYRWMPSYFTDTDTADAVAEAWRNGDSRYTQINFDELIARNRLNGGESIYAIADRVERIARIQLRATATTAIGERTEIAYGIDASTDGRRRYKQLRDMLGGEYVTDIDHYLIDDDTYGNFLQNNLLAPNRRAGEGDRYGYDYSLVKGSLAATTAISYKTDRLNLNAAIEAGYCTVHRRGHCRKELFADNSLGKSQRIGLSPYAVRIAAGYDFTKRHSMGFAAIAQGDAPEADDIFLQADYNNRTIDNPSLRNTYAAELNYRYSSPTFHLSATLFTSMSKNGTQVEHLYDDTSAEYCDMVVSGIDILRYGAEVEADVRVTKHLRLSLAASAGRYKYAGNPKITMYADSDNRIICENIDSFVGDCTTGGAPQILAATEISYFNRGWGVNVGANYAGLRYVTPSFLRRTERVAYMADSPELFREFVSQERLRDAFTLGASLSKTFYLSRFDKRIYTHPTNPRFIDRHPRSRITLFLSVRNLSGNRNIVYSGYESSRLHKQWIADGYTFRPQATRYLYAYPRTYYFAIRFTF